MKTSNKKQKYKKCDDCIHKSACQAWNIGDISSMNATNCVNYEILSESNAYFLGVRSAENDAYSRGCLAGIELGEKEALCGITNRDAKSMICTLDMFMRLAFNIHGVIDVVDDRSSTYHAANVQPFDRLSAYRPFRQKEGILFC